MRFVELPEEKLNLSKISGFVPRTINKFRVNSLYTFDKGKTNKPNNQYNAEKNHWQKRSFMVADTMNAISKRACT